MFAEHIAKALGGRKAGEGWTARCPAHDDRTPSLSIRDADDNKVLVRCHAGCDQERVIEALRGRGLWTERCPRAFPRPASRTVTARRSNQDDAQRRQMALAIWRSAEPAPGTLVETYLAERGIHLLPPDALRFANLRHPSGGFWPAMVALVTNGATGAPLAIHRTFLARDGGVKAPVEPQKMILGPCRGGAAQLASAGETLVLAEGIETALSVIAATGLPVWATLSAGNLAAVILPPLPLAAKIVIAADHDASGAGQRFAARAAERFANEGRGVCIALPPTVGADFNDLLAGFAP